MFINRTAFPAGTSGAEIFRSTFERYNIICPAIVHQRNLEQGKFFSHG
ncbi:MAG: hypothetical protein WCU00_11710 [Candidatus Latescibacterota bacterium]